MQPTSNTYSTRRRREPVTPVDEPPSGLPTSCFDKRKYKTRLCDRFMLDGNCEFGVRCIFAHGFSELRKNIVTADGGLYSSHTYDGTNEALAPWDVTFYGYLLPSQKVNVRFPGLENRQPEYRQQQEQQQQYQHDVQSLSSGWMQQHRSPPMHHQQHPSVQPNSLQTQQIQIDWGGMVSQQPATNLPLLPTPMVQFQAAQSCFECSDATSQTGFIPASATPYPYTTAPSVQQTPSTTIIVVVSE